MKKTLAMFVATTALTAAIGLPAWSAMRSTEAGGEERPFAAVLDERQEALPVILISDDDDEPRRWSGHNDDNDDCDDDDDDDDDDDEAGRGARKPAPAGSVAPPRNGLFGNSVAPRVQVN